MRWIWTLALVAAFPTLTLTLAAETADSIDPNNPNQGRFLDEWAVVYMFGAKVGYTHSTMSRQGNVIRTSTVTKMKLGRVSNPVRIATTLETTETLEGLPLTFYTDVDASIKKTQTKGTIKKGRVTLVTSQFGMEQKQSYDFPDGALMIWGVFRESLLRGFKPGTTYTLKTYSPELLAGDSIDATTRVGDWEEFDCLGELRRGQRTTVILGLEPPAGPLELLSWIDHRGHPLKAVLPMPGVGNMEMILTSQAEATKAFVPPEVFMKTVIQSPRKLDPKSLKRVKYRIRTTNPDTKLTAFPPTGMQTSTLLADGSVELVVSRQSHAPLTGGSRSTKSSSSTGELDEYLGMNLMINTADPELIKLASKASGGVKEPFALGDKLRRFVTDYIATKNLNVGFATASEVCRTREGDCSEHGVLLAALGRLNGLPSRVAVGVAYVRALGGRRDIFGYHMWTQFYIDGRWIDFDAAMRESDCSPTRIAFATSSLKHAGLADLSLPLLAKIGSISVDVLEVEKLRPPED